MAVHQEPGDFGANASNRVGLNSWYGFETALLVKREDAGYGGPIPLHLIPIRNGTKDHSFPTGAQKSAQQWGLENGGAHCHCWAG